MSNNGLRQVMAFFAQYGWTNEPEDDPESPRLIESYPLALLTFMLAGRARYSQALSQFPNAYMVTDGLGLQRVPGTQRTYWLKQALLRTLRAEGGMSIAEVEELFAGGPHSYPLNVVQLCLGDLTDSQRSSCLRTTFVFRQDDRGGRLVPQRVALNTRGEHCTQHLFDRFVYLQLVVEDYDLPVPRCLRDVLAYADWKNTPLDYRYVIAPRAAYFERGREMVRLKARQVLAFLVLLEEAFDVERRLYSDVFDELARRGTVVGDVARVRTGIVAELRSVAHAMGIALDTAALTASAEALRPEVRQALLAWRQ